MDKLGEAVAGLQARVTSEAARALQSAVESQLSAVQVGQLQSAIDEATLSGSVPSMIDHLTTSPVAGLKAPEGIYNAKGEPIDVCGDPVQELRVSREVLSFDQTPVGKTIKNLERATSGPISGPVYSAAWASGADDKKLDAIDAVGKALDAGFGVQKKRAEKPSFSMQPPTPADWNRTQR